MSDSEVIHPDFPSRSTLHKYLDEMLDGKMIPLIFLCMDCTDTNSARMRLLHICLNDEIAMTVVKTIAEGKQDIII